MVNPNLQSKVVKTKFLTHFDAKNRVLGAKTPLFLTFPTELTNFDLRFGLSEDNFNFAAPSHLFTPLPVP